MKRWLAVVLFALSVLTGAMWLKSFTSHTMLADTTSPVPQPPSGPGGPSEAPGR
jgi:hypothetical protein